MRIGFNPNKDKSQDLNDFFHQVVIPVYIPNSEGYFKDSFKILEYCLESLFKTSHEKVYFTIVNNGSCKEVVHYLNELYKNNFIQEVIHTSNIGKLNAILKGISGHNFDFITIADADVLFLNDWLMETYKVFEKFPKTGAVCPTPSSKSLKNQTYNIWFDLLFSKSLSFTKVKNPMALKAFASSVGNSDMYNSVHLKKYLTVAKDDFKAVVGAGHYVTTYRKEVFDNCKEKYSDYKLGGFSESKFLDIPVVKKGLWRLSTEDNFAYHMGNVEEDWMRKELTEMVSNEFVLKNKISFQKNRSSEIRYFFMSRIFSKILLNNVVWRFFLKCKGLSKEEVEKYV